MKIKLLLIPAFIFGSVLILSAQSKDPKDPSNIDKIDPTTVMSISPNAPETESTGGTSGKVEIKKSETAISTKQLNAPNANNDMDKNKNAVITTNKARIKSKSTK
jgi:hypothetical protein